MKLKKSLIYGLGILCLTCFASAQEGERKGPPPEGGQPGRPPGGPQGGGDPGARLAEFIKRADADGDGKISKEEFAGMGRAVRIAQSESMKFATLASVHSTVCTPATAVRFP